MSSAKSRNFRRRGDDGEDGNNDNDAATPSATARKASSKPKKLLSFADDEDEDTPSRSSSKSFASRKPTSRLSKASSSHKLTVSKDRTSPMPSSTTSNVLPQAGTYTKEALLELQKNTRTLAKPTSSASKTVSSSTSEPKIILKGLLKPVKEDSNSQTLEQPQHLNSEEEDIGRTDTEKRLASLGLGKSGDYSLIPDEETIKKIRARRERLRQSRAAAPDYISLDGGSNLGAAEGFSDEEPEFRTRIAMIGKKEGSTSHGVFEDFDNEDDDNSRVKAIIGANAGGYPNSNVVAQESKVSDNEEDEEDKIWEEEQFRKGLGKRMDDGTGSNRVFTGSAATVMPTKQQQPQRLTVYSAVPSIGGAFGASQGLDALPIPQQGEIARKALLEIFQRLKESYSRTVSSSSKTNENLSASLMNITSLEKSLSAAGEKFIFMQKLRDFVSVICEFLQHKAPYIEELEEQMQTLHEQRASSILERRIADNDDEMMEVEAAVKAAMLVFGEHGSSAAVIAAATSAAQAASASMKEQIKLPVKLDEFGRDINQQKRMDMRRRAEARQRRRSQFESKRFSSIEIDGSSQKIEGEASTDESDSESAAYQSNRDMLLQTADQIFGDASEEYSQLSVVKERFERWKNQYTASYRDAYISLSAPAIFSPYVRLELLKWDPLHDDADFYDMKWHSLLFNYGLPEDGSDPNSDDADGNLIPELIEKIAIPILHHEIAHCWDMLSTRETKNAVSATTLVINYVPSSSKALQELLVAIRTRLTDAVADIMVPTWSPLVLKAVPNAARIAAYRFGMSIRLMKNICVWKDILALPVLEKLALDELLCGKVLPHVRSIASNVHDAVTRTERIVASLSGVWAGRSVNKDPRHKLQSLVDYVMSLGRMLEKKHVSGVTETETSGLARRLKKMLVELNDYDSARDIARMFSLREAL
ncbi:transcriptional repressor ILP1 [Euphorbia lathyris]|uniref:transcriptional repressor ILP1 n=1 Tax=Euphorbia lathyris TaxID=212925 RepID=UPI0033133F4C